MTRNSSVFSHAYSCCQRRILFTIKSVLVYLIFVCGLLSASGNGDCGLKTPLIQWTSIPSSVKSGINYSTNKSYFDFDNNPVIVRIVDSSKFVCTAGVVSTAFVKFNLVGPGSNSPAYRVQFGTMSSPRLVCYVFLFHFLFLTLIQL